MKRAYFSFSVSLLLSLCLSSAVLTSCAMGGKKAGGDAKAGGGTAGDGQTDGAAGDGELNVNGEAPAAGGAVSEPTQGGPGGNAGSNAGSNAGRNEKKYGALAQAVRSGKSNSIIEEAAKVLSSNQNDAVALNTLALYHLRKGHLGAAKLLLNRAFEKNPASAPLLNNFGVLLLTEGDQLGAMNSFKQALKADDHHAQALGNLGSLYVQAGDYAKAKALLQPAYQQMRSSNPGVAINYAIVLRAEKDFEGAKGIYEELLKQNSRDVTTLLNYSILLIDYMNKPKDGLALVYKVKFIETDNRDILDRADALEKKAKSQLK